MMCGRFCSLISRRRAAAALAAPLMARPMQTDAAPTEFEGASCQAAAAAIRARDTQQATPLSDKARASCARLQRWRRYAPRRRIMASAMATSRDTGASGAAAEHAAARARGATGKELGF